MFLKIALLFSMLLQLGAAIISISMIRRTRYNISWILISVGFVLMAVRRLFDFSTLFWQSRLFERETVNNWLGSLISLLIFIGVIFIRQIFNMQERIDQIRKESESRILSAVIQTEEKDRQSFARELHDGLGPVLSSIKMTMSAVHLDVLDPANRRIIERSCRATDEAITSLKEISNNLSPHLLKNYGLMKALQTFADHLFTDSPVIFEIQSDIQDKRFSYDIEISLYRVLCELMTNSLKHAEASTINLEIREDDFSLILKYQDDGKGFAPGKYSGYNNPQGMGLENIRSRIKSLNGDYSVDSNPGKGFSVYIRVPQER